MPSNLAAASAITKVGYGDMHEQLDDYLTALKLIDKSAKHITDGNVEVQYAAHMGRNQGVGARNEGQSLPTALQNKDARASLFLKYQYGRIQGTGQIFEQVSSNTEGFVNWMDREMTGIQDTLQRDLNRQVYSDGTGTLCLVTVTATAATTITVDDAHFVEVDMYIHVLTQATLGNAIPTQGNTAALLVTAVDTVNNIITFTGGTVTAAIASAVVRGDPNGVDNNWKREWEGLGLIVSSATLHNINPASFTRWLPGYTQSSVGTLTELTITHLAQGIHQQGGKVTDLLTSYGVVNAYWNILQGKRQFVGDQVDHLKGGATTPAFQSVFGEIPITPDWAAPRGTMYALNSAEMLLHRVADWDWMNKTGTMWQQVVNTDAYSATMFQYSNLGVYRRNSFGKLSGITEV
jgi:hypothetical protein